MLSVGVLCSGTLGFSILKHIDRNYNIRFVLTDSKSNSIISYAKKRNIPIFAGNPRNGKGFHFIKSIEVDIIASINYLFLIEKDIIEHPEIIAFNIHGSLLPKYRGRTPHVWAIINGEQQTGITAHIIDADCDTGNIIHQIVVDIEADDTGTDILNKFTELYIPLFDKVLLDVNNNTLTTRVQDNSKATYFGKRTPADGEIDWNWSKERIRNWVRAQSYPYPGAFTFLDGKKVIIDKVSTTETNEHTLKKSGEIVSTDSKVKIKVNDGLIILEEIRSENHTFNIGKRFTNENRK